MVPVGDGADIADIVYSLDTPAAGSYEKVCLSDSPPTLVGSTEASPVREHITRGLAAYDLPSSPTFTQLLEAKDDNGIGVGERLLGRTHPGGYHAAAFPRPGEDGRPNPSLPADFYACDSAGAGGHAYPVAFIARSTQTNAPFLIPCCQSAPPPLGSTTIDLFRELEKTVRERQAEGSLTRSPREARVLPSSSMAVAGEMALLPANIERVFQDHQTTTPSDARFVHIGVPPSKASVLHCLSISAMAPAGITSAHKNNELMNDVERPNSDRHRIAGEMERIFQSGLQELFDTRIDVVTEELLDTDAYVDPRRFVRILEEAYNLTIIVFTRSAFAPDGELMIPRHTGVYIPPPIDERRRVVCVLEHASEDGSRQCSLIGARKLVGKGNGARGEGDGLVVAFPVNHPAAVRALAIRDRSHITFAIRR